jgi:Putative MetA-pathway of phenol degradation
MTMTHAILAAVALLLAAGGARAAHPLLTEDTGTVGAGNYQLELTAELARQSADGSTLHGVQPAAVLSYGVLPNADLQLGQPWLRAVADDGDTREVAEGALDTSLDLKWRFYERGALSLGLKPGITLPTGDDARGLGAGRLTWGALLIASYQPAGPLAFHAHLGYRRYRNTLGQRESLGHISGALVYATSAKLKLVADLSADTDPSPSASGTLRHTVLGLIYSPRADLDLDAGIKRRLVGDVIDRSLLLGATLRW